MQLLSTDRKEEAKGGILGFPRPLGITPLASILKTGEEKCDKKEGDMVQEFTFELDRPTRAKEIRLEVGDITGPGLEEKEPVVPTVVGIAGPVRKDEIDLELEEFDKRELDTEVAFVKKIVVLAVPPQRGFDRIQVCVS